jgi:hypothetical protein
VCLLGVPAADLVARDLGGDRQHRNAASVGIEQPVEQMRVSGPAARGAYRELSGEGRFRGRGEGRGLFVPDVQPLDAALAAQRVSKTVQRVARQPVDTADAAGHQVGDDRVGHGTHGRVRRSVTMVPA